jgi:NitT/TauT family transport system substrate-binding protein
MGLPHRTISALETEGNVITRRNFLARASALGASSSLLGLPGRAAAEPPPEVRRIRLLHPGGICLAPQYVAEEFLRQEGFRDVQYVDPGTEAGGLVLASGRVDITMYDVPSLIPVLDEAQPILVLAGVHAGCYELFARTGIRGVGDLKGKAIATAGPGDSDYVLLSSMLAYVGINPRSDVRWIVEPIDHAKLFLDGKADAILAFAPQPQELRRAKVGHVIVNTAQDRPWSQYFCCVVAGNREFVRANPVATKRALRAILKGADLCAADPERAARYMADKGFEERYAVGLEVMRELPYRRWRDANPEDTLRFHALRLHEVGMIKTTPNKLIAQGTDWRFLNELKKELKA